MTEFAVIRVEPIGEHSAPMGWYDTAAQAISEATRLNEQYKGSATFRAVESTRFGTFRSLTGESLYSDTLTSR